MCLFVKPKMLIDMDYKSDVELLGHTFGAIVKNNSTMGMQWKNIYLSRVAAEILLSYLPDSLPGEFDDMAGKVRLLEQMLSYCPETDMPRAAIALREVIDNYAPNDDNTLALTKLREYIDPAVDASAWCEKWGRHLQFDPVERSERWEEVIYDVEKEVAQRLNYDEWHMGFCYRYWSVKEDVLADMGLEWHSPSAMNPDVMFD